MPKGSICRTLNLAEHILPFPFLRFLAGGVYLLKLNTVTYWAKVWLTVAISEIQELYQTHKYLQ